MSGNRLARWALGAALALLGNVAWAQGVTQGAGQESSGTMTIPVRVVEGHIMVLGFLSNRTGDVTDVSLELTFDEPKALVLSGKMMEWLDNPATVKLTLKPDVQLQFGAAEVKEDENGARQGMFQELTAMYSSKLDEHKAVGALGVGFLRKYHAVLDLAAGKLTLSPPGSPVDGAVVRAFSLDKNLLTFPVDFAGGKSGLMALGGSAYDTFIDKSLASSLGKPAGDVTPFWLGPPEGINLSAQMALRPGDLSGFKGLTALAGVNFFEAFRVEADFSQSKVAFTPIKKAEYPQADFEYFQAELANTPAAYRAYLEKYENARLSVEAAQRLINALVQANDKNTTDAQYMQAMKWFVGTFADDRKMDGAANAVNTFRDNLTGRDALVEQAGLYALQFSRAAVTVQGTYRMHNIIGEACLNQGKVEEGWKHLLSAAFMPLDNKQDLIHNIEVQYYLATAYERMGRAGRAYSRFVRTEEYLTMPLGSNPSLKEQLAEAPSEEQILSQPPDKRRQIRFLLKAISDTDAALKRLKQQIPADELEMLEG